MEDKKKIWLAAVSAGPDSMAMLDMCIKRGIPVAAAHVNYHHRRQAEAEEAYLREYCRIQNIPLFVRNEPFIQKGNFEADARQWRYDFFVRIVKENHYEGVLVAHQEDDLIETYLMQKERHLVPEWYGLRKETVYQGIRVVRPLLGVKRAQLRKYCEDNSVKYYIDATNDDLSIARNRIRHEIVENLKRDERDQILKKINEENSLKEETERKAYALITDEGICLSEYTEADDEVRYTALRRLLDERHVLHLTLAYIKEADQVIMHHRDFMIPFRRQYIVTKDDRIFLYAEKPPYEDTYCSMEEIVPSVHEGYRIEEGSPSVFAVTVKESDFPITIRSFHEGDAIVMRFGTKQVARFFVDRHIPLFERKNWPVVVNRQGEIMLVPGLGCSEAHYSPKPTFNVLQYTHPEEKNCKCGKKKI